MAGIPSSPTDRKAILDCMKEISASMTRMAAERELIKEAIDDICEKHELSKKTFRRMAKVYHKQNFNSELEEHQEFESMYETITGTTTMDKEYA
jgi:TRAP-type C4-dicarboxylate transport system substrate-binding protein